MEIAMDYWGGVGWGGVREGEERDDSWFVHEEKATTSSEISITPTEGHAAYAAIPHSPSERGHIPDKGGPCDLFFRNTGPYISDRYIGAK